MFVLNRLCCLYKLTRDFFKSQRFTKLVESSSHNVKGLPSLAGLIIKKCSNYKKIHIANQEIRKNDHTVNTVLN